MKKLFLIFLICFCSFSVFAESVLQIRIVRDLFPEDSELPADCEKVEYFNRFIFVEKKIIIDEKDIQKISIDDDKNAAGRYCFTFYLTKKGRKTIKQVTGKNIGNAMAIILNNKILACGKIYEKIDSPSLELSGYYKDDPIADELKKNFQVEDNRISEDSSSSLKN